MTQKLLSICIPTCNRAEILDEAISALVPLLSEYDIEIIISDNASTDNTPEVVEKYKSLYPEIVYHRNSQNIGPDRNFIQSLLLSVSHYQWLLGDSYRIDTELFKSLYDRLNSRKYSGMILNFKDRIRNIPSGEYTDAIQIFDLFGWHMTLMSSIIFSKEFLVPENYEKHLDSSFVHLGTFFEHLLKLPDFRIYWSGENVIQHTRIPKIGTSWLSDSFYIFGKRWYGFVMSLPDKIPLENKLACIKAHSINTGLFNAGSLLRLKVAGAVTKEKVQPLREYIPYITDTPWWLIRIFIHMPVSVARIILTVSIKLRRLLRHIMSTPKRQ